MHDQRCRPIDLCQPAPCATIGCSPISRSAFARWERWPSSRGPSTRVRHRNHASRAATQPEQLGRAVGPLGCGMKRLVSERQIRGTVKAERSQTVILAKSGPGWPDRRTSLNRLNHSRPSFAQPANRRAVLQGSRGIGSPTWQPPGAHDHRWPTARQAGRCATVVPAAAEPSRKASSHRKARAGTRQQGPDRLERAPPPEHSAGPECRRPSATRAAWGPRPRSAQPPPLQPG